MTQNQKRAKRVHKSLNEYYEKGWRQCPARREQALSDLLADCRHYCDRHKLEFHVIDGRAYENYTAEFVGERKRK